jgi:hypothetical protein
MRVNGWTRRREFWWQAVKQLPAVYGTAQTVLAAVAAVSVVTGVGYVAGLVTAASVGVLVLLLMLGEASYQEWDRWAPHDPPRLTITPYLWPAGGFSVQITNDDVDAVLRASVTGVTGSDRPLMQPSDHPFPWTLVWGDQQTEDYRLIRHETAQVPVVGVNPLTQTWLFAGPKGPHEMQAELETGEQQTDISVQLRITRLEPASGFVERRFPVSFPRGSGQAAVHGSSGPSRVGASRHYVHEQRQASAVWTVNHNLGKVPAVTVVDTAGTEVIGDVRHVDENTALLTFSAPFSGKAICN